jgi:hypothetical protein
MMAYAQRAITKNCERVTLFILLALPLSLTSCLAAGAGVGAISAVGSAYAKGLYNSTEAVPLGHLWIATIGSLENLGIPIERENLDERRGFILARRADGKAIQIELLTQSPRISQLRIRVGTFGDESFSELIAERVHSKLSNRKGHKNF